MNEKKKWTLLLLIDLFLFLVALNWNNYLFYFLIILFSFWIYKQGNSVLFYEYDEKRRQQQAEFQQVQTVVKESIRARKILEKKRR